VADILKEFSRKATLAYARARQPRTYVGPTLFPLRQVNELTFEYWKDLNLLPVMASVQAFGAEAQIASRDGAEKVTGEIPTIKRKIPLNGRALVALRREGAGDLDFVRNTLYTDLDNMIDAVEARVEQMRMDAVAYGKIVLNENGVIMTVDYGVPAIHQETLSGTDLWSDHQNAKPIDNIMEWVRIIVADTGIRPTRALTSDTVVANLLQCKQIRQMIYGDLGATRAISLNQVNELMRTLDLPVIATYDLQVRRQNADGSYTTSRFFPEDKFVLLPPDRLGETLDGPTEDAMLDPEIEASEVAGIYAAVYKQSMDPPVIETKAAACRIPTFPMADTVFQATVIQLSS